MLAVSTQEKVASATLLWCLVTNRCDTCAHSNICTLQGLDRMCEESNYEDFDVNKFMEGMK